MNTPEKNEDKLDEILLENPYFFTS